eukprot:TRINITY_DN5232_c0_g1_i1.p1 TRINITY_DN5232_c0_g1~~TRINITY_DN5232_c0_g1_i1.p1  ORF type:complete len:213 (-),score=67.94 TRINITY_DN5232_c0_g1_i1:44-682(-)
MCRPRGHSENCKILSAWKQEISSSTSSTSSSTPPPPPRPSLTPRYPSRFLFPEMEIVTEDEPPSSSSESSNEKALVTTTNNNNNSKNWEDKDNKDMESAFKSDVTTDPFLIKFQARVRREPDQVLRYTRQTDLQPLWVQEKGRLPSSENIPPCPLCLGPRCFEFQVLPQLLYHLKVETTNKNSGGNVKEATLDWGTIVVYTCSASCSISSSG